MARIKQDVQQHPAARPIGGHRLSMTSNLSSSAPRSSHSRNHSHSISAGSINPAHRVTRRKSVSVNNTNPMALAAALREAGGDSQFTLPVPMNSTRRNTMSRPGSKFVGLSTPPASLPSNKLSLLTAGRKERDESAIDDQNEDVDGDSFGKQRARRASEGQSTKDGKKNELKCDKCGKGYKHSSCLTKHLFVPMFPYHPFLPCLEIRD